MMTAATAAESLMEDTQQRKPTTAENLQTIQVTAAIGTYMGSSYINDFDFNNRSYRVYVQADQQFRRNASDLRAFYVRSDAGQMIPLDNLVMTSETSGPQVINHYNMFRSAENRAR